MVAVMAIASDRVVHAGDVSPAIQVPSNVTGRNCSCRNAKRLHLPDLIRQNGECPFGQGDEIGSQRQQAFEAEGAVIRVADIGELGEAWDRFQIARVDRWAPAGP